MSLRGEFVFAQAAAEERMKQGYSFLKFSVQGLLATGLLSICAVGLGQAKPATMPDAQIESNPVARSPWTENFKKE